MNSSGETLQLSIQESQVTGISVPEIIGYILETFRTYYILSDYF